MKKILILGGGGFIGGHLAKKLKEDGCWVRICDVKKHEYFQENKICHEFIQGDLKDINIVKKYQIYHDCGKPYCLVIDDLGKRHFPEHAKVSESIWIQLFGKSTISNLIGMDMDIHLLKSDQTEEFLNRPEAATLLLTGLAEIHSNAIMFGGIDSTSFKIKWKKINKIGKKLLNKLNQEESNYAK